MKSFFINESILKDGESQLFHLKSGNQIVLRLEDNFYEKNPEITIKSYNMKMTPYKMFLEIIDKNQPDKILNAPINKNWIGGQQANIKPNTDFNLKNYNFRIIFVAEADGILNVEARTNNSNIKLNDKILKFESIKENHRNCYSYNIINENKGEELIYEIKSIKGKLNYIIFAENVNSIPALKGEVLENTKERIILNSSMRRNEIEGNWKICVSCDNKGSNNMGLYTLQAYMGNNHEHVKEYQRMLYGKF